MGLAGIVAIVAVGATAAMVGRCVGGRSAVSVILAGALVGYVEIMAVLLALSSGAHLTVGWLAIVTTAIALVVVLTGFPRRPPGPEWRLTLGSVRAVLTDDRAICVLAIAVAASLSYALALALFTPPAEGDAIAYHLARAAYWVQQHGVGSVSGNVDPRIDEFPPGAELAVAFTMLTSGGTRLIGFVQFLSVIAAMIAIVGLARRIGIDMKLALPGALLFPTLSVVALQAPTALNDVVVAALVGIAAYFLLGERRVDTALGALALGALGLTKVSAGVAIPGVFIVALVAARGERRARALGLAVACGTVPGLLWILFGPTTEDADHSIAGVPISFLNGDVDIVGAFARFCLLLTETLDLPGAEGRDVLVYAIAALVVLGITLIGHHSWRTGALVGTLVGGTMLLLPIAELAIRSYRKVWYLLGRHDLETLDPNRNSTSAEATSSWYGPVALVLACVVLIAAIRLVRGRGHHPVVLALAASPLLWIAAFALIAEYIPTTGRYLMGSIVLSAATWGLALAWRPLTWWAVVVATVTVGLAYVHSDERPSGVRLLEGGSPMSVWTRPDAVALGPSSTTPPVFAFVEEHVPDNARIASWPNFWWSPFFGPSLSRTVLLAPSIVEAERLEAEWVIYPVEAAPPCVDGWSTWTISSAFRAYERASGATCG